MKTMTTMIRSAFFALLMTPSIGFPQQPSVPGPAIQGIQGVNQKAGETIKPIDPPAAKSAAVNQAQGVAKAEAAETVKAVTLPAPSSAQPLPPPPDSVEGVPPPPAARAVISIRPVKGVTGILAPKQRNLEAALRIKEATESADRRSRAAAAALLRSRKQVPDTQKIEDSRAEFQEFAEQNTPGS